MQLKRTSTKITLTHKTKPIIPSHILPIIQNKQGARKMYDILNANDEIPTGKQTWNKRERLKKKKKKQVYVPF